MKTLLVADRKGGCGEDHGGDHVGRGAGRQRALAVGLADADRRNPRCAGSKARPRTPPPSRPRLDPYRRCRRGAEETARLAGDRPTPGALGGSSPLRGPDRAEARSGGDPSFALVGFGATAPAASCARSADQAGAQRTGCRYRSPTGLRSGLRSTDRLRAFFVDRPRSRWLDRDRSAYPELAEQGLAVFDRPQRLCSRCATNGRRCSPRWSDPGEEPRWILDLPAAAIVCRRLRRGSAHAPERWPRQAWARHQCPQPRRAPSDGRRDPRRQFGVTVTASRRRHRPSRSRRRPRRRAPILVTNAGGRRPALAGLEPRGLPQRSTPTC